MLEIVSVALLAGVDVDAHSFTAGADYRAFAITMTGFSGGSADTLRDIISSGGKTMIEAEDADGSASNRGGKVFAPTAENETFAIGLNPDNSIVVMVDVVPEHDAPEWNVIAGIGMFTGSFIIKF